MKKRILSMLLVFVMLITMIPSFMISPLAATNSGLIKYADGNWYYVQNGQVNRGKTGLIKHTNGIWYYVEKGKINWKYTGLVKHTNGIWYYVQKGEINWKYTGLVKHTNGIWYYVQKGQINWNYTGLIKHTNGIWYYVQKGQINWNYTGLVKHTNSIWYYVQKGQINWNYTGLVKHTNGKWYYVEKGQINWNYTGTVAYKGKYYSVVQGVNIGATDPPITSIKTKEYNTGSVKQTVYYPDNIDAVSKPYPVIAWANGTMVTSGFYDKLLIEIAKGGYIVVACDESMSADGTAQIASIDFILNKNNDANDIFYNKIDTNKIGVVGHSQGGRSSVNAATADSRIDCVVSIAGSNYDYEVEPLNTPTFFIAGTNDLIVMPSQWIVPAYEIAKGPTVYASLNGGIHTTCSTNPEKYSSYIIDWLNSWLKNDTSALNTFKNGGKLSKDSDWVDFRCKNIGFEIDSADEYDTGRVF